GGIGGKSHMLLRDLLGVLRDAYTRKSGYEYMHIDEPEQRAWFQEKLEHPFVKPTREEQLRILGRLNAAEAFETFLQTQFVGQNASHSKARNHSSHYWTQSCQVPLMKVLMRLRSAWHTADA